MDKNKVGGRRKGGEGEEVEEVYNERSCWCCPEDNNNITYDMER